MFFPSRLLLTTPILLAPFLISGAFSTAMAGAGGNRMAVFMTANDPPSADKIRQWISEGGMPADHTVIQLNP